MKGKDAAVNRKYILEAFMTASSTEPKTSFRMPALKTSAISITRKAMNITERTICRAASLAFFVSFAPIYWEQMMVPPVAMAENI